LPRPDAQTWCLKGYEGESGQNFSILYLEVLAEVGCPGLMSEGDEGEAGLGLCFALDPGQAAALLGATGITTGFLPGWSHHFLCRNELLVKRCNELLLLIFRIAKQIIYFKCSYINGLHNLGFRFFCLRNLSSQFKDL